MWKLNAYNIGKRFGRRVLFRRLSLEVGGGEVVAVTGANGTGKSTLLRILAGVLAPSTGAVQLSDDSTGVSREERPLKTGFVAPYLNVYDGFSARENLAFLARARRLSGASSRIDRLLAEVSLSERADDLVSTYSSGMRQRVKFAAALLCEPPLLLLDEPSTNLDPAGLEIVSQVIDRWRTARRIVIVATNQAGEAAACDRRIEVTDYAPGPEAQ